MLLATTATSCSAEVGSITQKEITANPEGHWVATAEGRLGIPVAVISTRGHQSTLPKLDRKHHNDSLATLISHRHDTLPILSGLRITGCVNVGRALSGLVRSGHALSMPIEGDTPETSVNVSPPPTGNRP
jgi:hypothetical protein